MPMILGVWAEQSERGLGISGIPVGLMCREMVSAHELNGVQVDGFEVVVSFDALRC